MKTTTKILNLFTAFLAVIGICAASLVCFIVIYTSVNGNFSSNQNNVSSENFSTAESDSTINQKANAHVALSENIFSSEDTITSSDFEDESNRYPEDTESDILPSMVSASSDIIQNKNNLNTGWVKEAGLWYYYEPTGEKRIDNLQTDVMTFTFNSDGSCSNFYDNATPSTQAGWCPYSTTSLDTLANDVIEGRIVYYNGQYWATPDYYSMLKNTTVVYEHDISADTGQSMEPVDRYSSANLDISFPDSDNETSSLTGLQSSETAQTSFYVLNTSTQKIHYPTCRDVENILFENYSTSNLSISELNTQGYTTCGHCFK